MAHDPNVQREEDLGVRRHQAVLQGAAGLHAEEARGELGRAIALAVHEEAAAVGMQDGAETPQDLEDHALHVHALLHVLHQLEQGRALLHLAQLLETGAARRAPILAGAGHILRAQLLSKVYNKLAKKDFQTHNPNFECSLKVFGGIKNTCGFYREITRKIIVLGSSFCAR